MSYNKVWVSETNIYGEWLYFVHVDGCIGPYDKFSSKTPLTWAQQREVAEMYQEAINGHYGNKPEEHLLPGAQAKRVEGAVVKTRRAISLNDDG